MPFKKGGRPWNAGQRVEVACGECGATLLRTPFEVARSKVLYCDRACAAAALKRTQAGSLNPRYGVRRGETRACPACGKDFYSYPSQPKRYCSAACYFTRIGDNVRGKPKTPEQRAKQAAAMTGRPQQWHAKPPLKVTCPTCGLEREWPGRRAYRAAKQRFCSTDCWYAYLRLHPEAGGSFKGGYEPYYGPNWAHQARLARERDNHTCQACGVRQFNPRLDVHHIQSRRSFGRDDYERMNALANLISLCKSCHKKVEGHALP
jgi:5-methylcytosine-specific restriction endonuclease McrA